MKQKIFWPDSIASVVGVVLAIGIMWFMFLSSSLGISSKCLLAFIMSIFVFIVIYYSQRVIINDNFVIGPMNPFKAVSVRILRKNVSLLLTVDKLFIIHDQASEQKIMISRSMFRQNTLKEVENLLENRIN